MKWNKRSNFFKIRKTDPSVIKLTKLLLILDFLIVIGLLATLNIWGKNASDVFFSYEIVMRGGSTYYVPKFLGFTIHGGMVLFPALFLFTFSYLFWPLTKEEQERYLKEDEKAAREEKKEIIR